MLFPFALIPLAVYCQNVSETTLEHCVLQVAVVVETKGKDTINVAIDSISISTKHCHRSPVHSLPG